MIATGVGSLPGADADAYAEAVRLVLGELPDLPHLPELPGRGVVAGMTGRGVAVLSGLAVDLQPAGWRLTGSSGVDHRRARSLLAQDLDVLEEQAQGYAGRVKVQVAGPWTMAATVEKPRGDRVLADAGARRELAQALAEGVAVHVGDVRRRLPGATEVWVQVDEPALPAVLGGQVPTASGFGRHRSVHPPEAAAALGWVTEAVLAAGGIPLVHCCAAEVPVDLLRGAGFVGIGVDLDAVAATAYTGLAEALEAGERVLLGVVGSVDPPTAPTEREVTDRVLGWLDMVGLDPAGSGERLVLTPACGLAGASPQWARQALALVRGAARNLTAG